MDAASPGVDQAAQAEQRKLEKLFSLIFIIGGGACSIACLFDRSDGLFTVWDDYGAGITSLLYLVSGLLTYLRPKWMTAAVLVSMIATAIYQQGVMVVAVHQPGAASLYSAAASGAFFPLFYVALFVMLPRGAALFSWIHCAGFYVQFLLGVAWFTNLQHSPERLQAEHFLVETMMAHPIYIVALTYIVRLRERLHASQQDVHRAKENFIGVLSHEIRNQLQTMIGSIELLEPRLKDPAGRRSVARLQGATTQLQTFLRDINELTKLEDPALRIEKSRVDLGQLLDELRDEWLPLAQEQGLQLTVEAPADGLPMLIETDKARLRQIIVNLVSNAIKYTDTGGVTLAARVDVPSPGGVTVEVVDTGIGIEEKFLELIFQPHVRLGNAQSFCAAGSGLGLAIVERLVASLGGSVRAESLLHRGSKFYVTLPGPVGRQ